MMKRPFFKILVGLCTLFIIGYLLNKYSIGNNREITLIVKVVDNETINTIAGVDIKVSEEKTPLKIPFPGTIMKEYHRVYDTISDNLGQAKFILKKKKKYLIEFESRDKKRYYTSEFTGVKLEEDTVIIVKKI